jgi:hypothetical protein
VVDYDSLKHNCLEYYAYYYGLYEEGLLTDEDLAYRRRLVLSWLPRAILKDAWRLKHKEFFLLFRKALGYFGREFKFNIVVFPLLLAGNVPFMRQFYYLIFVSIQCLKRQPLQQMKKNA